MYVRTRCHYQIDCNGTGFSLVTTAQLGLDPPDVNGNRYRMKPRSRARASKFSGSAVQQKEANSKLWWAEIIDREMGSIVRPWVIAM